MNDGTDAVRPAVNEEDRTPWAIAFRIFVYLVGVHVIAAFLFLLFYLGGAK
ncbi:DUF6126 family protein [Streptomyces sp. NPDC018031]|uniref:DUF6126 family protein n=1 Tax=Streptomyces sp. NPDC018031 TaxID=3365033 RepID=UPI00378B5AE2